MANKNNGKAATATATAAAITLAQARKAFADGKTAAATYGRAAEKIGKALSILSRKDADGKRGYELLSYVSLADCAAAMGVDASAATRMRAVYETFYADAATAEEFRGYAFGTLAELAAAANNPVFSEKYAAATPCESVRKFLAAEKFNADSKRDSIRAAVRKACGKADAKKADAKKADAKKADGKADAAAAAFAAAFIRVRNSIMASGNAEAADAFAALNKAAADYSAELAAAIDAAASADAATRRKRKAEEKAAAIVSAAESKAEVIETCAARNAADAKKDAAKARRRARRAEKRAAEVIAAANKAAADAAKAAE